MKTLNLHDQWSSPDNSRLTSKQFSFRLPSNARIALCRRLAVSLIMKIWQFRKKLRLSKSRKPKAIKLGCEGFVLAG